MGLAAKAPGMGPNAPSAFLPLSDTIGRNDSPCLVVKRVSPIFRCGHQRAARFLGGQQHGDSPLDAQMAPQAGILPAHNRV